MQREDINKFKVGFSPKSKGASSKLFGLAVGALFTSGLSCAILGTEDASALTCDTSSMVSCIDITFGEIVGGTNLKAPSSDSTTHGIDKAYFYLPVSLTIARSSDYSIKVYSQNGGELRSSNGDVIPTLAGEAGKGTSLQDLGKNGSVWGYRSNLGDVAEDPTKNYLKVPSINDSEANIISGEQIDSTSGTIKKVLTLGFATAIDGNLPAGSYSDQIVVAVTATPLQTTAFGTISTMQEMTPEICASATTPSRDAELSDATGVHHGDNRYVPEATLTDIRDGKTYLVRKLADGNCWMGQNLALDLSPSGATDNAGKATPLTSDNTDLTSKNIWAPTTTTYQEPGVKWEQNDGIDRSISYQADYYWTGKTGDDAFTPTGDPAYGGQVGYAMRGNYYNWFAATAGSGKATDINTTTEAGTIAGTNRIKDGTVQDSICPKGWTLPTGGVTTIGQTDGKTKSFYNLTQIYTGVTGNIANATVDTLYAFPMQFVASGYYDYDNGIIASNGSGQVYWSNIVANATLAWAMNFLTDTVYPSTTYGTPKGYGITLRCVAR